MASSTKTTTTTTTTTKTTKRCAVPMVHKKCGFFDGQKANYSNWVTNFDDTFKDTDAESKFEQQLQKVQGDLYQVDGGSGRLEVSNPFVTDASGNQKLTLRYDVSKYKPEEITVTTVDNKVSVHAQHVDERPGKTVRSEFTRDYLLPEHVDPRLVTSTLTTDGVLLIEAPVKLAVEAPRENLVPIQHL